MFHLLEHDGEGGESLFQDAFYAARQLYKHHPRSFQTLARVPMPSSYVDKSDHYTPAIPGPILVCQRTWDTRAHLTPADLLQVRHNNDDRGILGGTSAPWIRGRGAMRDLYRALTHWQAALAGELGADREDGQLWMRLRPGTAVLFDNWRVLHGRAAFTGPRTIVGCYIGMDEYRSRLRVVAGETV